MQACKAAGIRTTDKLLELAKTQGPQGARRQDRHRREAAAVWANLADRMRIKGLGEPNMPSCLRAAGVDTVKELKYRNPAKLAAGHAQGQRQAQAGAAAAVRKAVGRWIEHAKKLPPKITY